MSSEKNPKNNSFGNELVNAFTALKKINLSTKLNIMPRCAIHILCLKKINQQHFTAKFGRGIWKLSETKSLLVIQIGFLYTSPPLYSPDLSVFDYHLFKLFNNLLKSKEYSVMINILKILFWKSSIRNVDSTDINHLLSPWQMCRYASYFD